MVVRYGPCAQGGTMYISKQMIDVHEIVCEYYDAGGQSTLVLIYA